MIKIMPEQLANQIAAGEVVERPASVVKEGIENSFDAASKNIEISLENAGSQLIVIKDDGCGIEDDQLFLALSRHATSKISSLEDLDHLVTMGFRGEALASIASVSKLTLASRRQDNDLGYFIETEAGILIKEGPVAMSYGSEIKIAELFYNTPARRRFMRSEKTEMNAIEDIFKRLALSNAEVTMSLKADGKLIRSYPAANDKTQKNRLEAIMNPSWYAGVDFIEKSNDFMSITAWVSKPQHTRAMADWQYLFINSRSIKDINLSMTVKRAMADLLYSDRHPSWIIHLSIDPSKIDVNIHPTKDKVRFDQPSLVYDFIYLTIRNFFTKKTIEPVKTNYMDNPSFPKPGFEIKNNFSLWDKVLPNKNNEQNINQEQNTKHIKEIVFLEEIEAIVPKALCQFNKAYMMATYGDKFWIIDIHAAHERVLLEKVKVIFASKKFSIQNLLMPIIIDDLPLELISNNIDFFKQHGFFCKIENNRASLCGYPSSLSVDEALDVIYSLAQKFSLSLTVIDDSIWTELLGNLACRLAVKADRLLTLIEMQHLLNDLLDMVEVCNHGRPWKWEISLSEMDKFFMRGQ